MLGILQTFLLFHWIGYFREVTYVNKYCGNYEKVKGRLEKHVVKGLST